MTLAEILAPVLGTITFLAVFALLAFLIHIFLSKTTIGMRIKANTSWMGWYEDINDDYTEFVIHPSNYIKVPSSR